MKNVCLEFLSQKLSLRILHSKFKQNLPVLYSPYISLKRKSKLFFLT